MLAARKRFAKRCGSASEGVNSWVRGKHRVMAESPSRHPGFGNSGKSFLIDNLLRPGNKSPIPAAAQKRCFPGLVGGPLGLTPKSTWGPSYGAQRSNLQEVESETLKPGKMASSSQCSWFEKSALILRELLTNVSGVNAVLTHQQVLLSD